MYATNLAEKVQTYLDLQTTVDECLADSRDARGAADDAARARRDVLDELHHPGDAGDGRALADATRAFLAAEEEFDAANAAGRDLDAPARRMERARRDIERQLHDLTGDDVRAARARRIATATKPAASAPPARPRSRRILVAVDEGQPARWALEVAVRMAQESAARLVLLHVIRPAVAAAGEYAGTLELLDTACQRDACTLLDRVRATLPPAVDADCAVREGFPGDQILAAARECDADLIVMGTRGRGRLTQFLMGSTAEAVIRRAACPVVAVSRRAPWAAPGGAPSDAPRREVAQAAN